MALAIQLILLLALLWSVVLNVHLWKERDRERSMRKYWEATFDEAWEANWAEKREPLIVKKNQIGGA